MSRFIFSLFAIWFLLLPFTIITSIYLGVTAIDKQMAPVLIVFWIMLYMSGRYSFDRQKLKIIALAFSFFFARNLSLINDTPLLLSVMWEEAIRFGYFCLPILFINNINRIKTAGLLISINATVGCVSAFMVALGLLTLPYERFSDSRIGFGIQKSIGLFTSYGDLAQYAAFFIVIAIFAPSTLVSGKNKKKLFVISAIVIIIMGLIGNQSRSYLLSVVIALLMGALFYYRSKNKINSTLFNIVLGWAGILFASIVIFTLADIINLLSNMGGSQAQGTAEARLSQYKMAFDLIRQYPIFGVDSAFFAKYSGYIHGIHNMWLGQLARGGVVSTLILLSLLFMIFKYSLSSLSNPQKNQYTIAPIGYIFAVFVSTLFYPADSFLFWTLLGMNAAIVTSLRTIK